MNPTDTTNADNFRAKLAALINEHSLENGSNVPDFILADYLNDCLRAFDAAVNRAASLRHYAEQPPTHGE